MRGRILVAISCALGSSFSAAVGQEIGELPVFDEQMVAGEAPLTDSGAASFFSQELGTLLRIRYNTQSYGQDRRGNLDLGTMRVANFEDAIAFFDGQATLSDVQGVGFNLGVGFRWLHWVPFPLEPERITGFSIWADGTSTESGNFFPQVGVSYESLGDMWDFRVNSYIPVGSRSQLGTFTETGDIAYSGNFLVLESLADRNTSFNVGEIEVARRLLGDRDAWAFAGPYMLANDNDDAAGYRVGLRGYAYPDLLVQLAVTDDDIFKTNAAFSVTWFVGRTRTNFQPACGLLDRMREPVMRNDYVTLAKDTVTSGEALTNTDGEAFRFVHVNSAAPAGGDGTFENPLNDVGNVQGNSQESDIVLLYSNSLFVGQNTLVLQDNQRLLGEGNNEIFTINTLQEGIVEIPETSPGARAGNRPIIMNALGMGAIQLADANEVANINIDGGAMGLFSPAGGAGNPNIHDMMIENTTGDAIFFTPIAIVDMNDVDGDGNLTETIIRGNVTIDDMVFNNVGGNDIQIVGTTQNVSAPNTTLQEVITISDVMSTDGNDFSLAVSNTHSGAGRTTTVTNYNYNGGANAAGGILLTDFDGTFNASTSTFMNGTLAGLQIAGESDGTFTLANTVSFESIDGTVVNIGPSGTDDFTGTLNFNAEITNNDTGRLVSIQRISDNASLTFTGDMMDVANAGSTGIFIGNNTEGTILFTGDLTVNTTNAHAIQLLNNGTTDISFAGVLDLVADGAGANGFDAENGGMLTVTNTGNTVSTDGGVGVRIVDMAINNAGVNFSEVNVTGGATNGIFLTDNTGGPITIGTLGDPVGDSGTIDNTTGDAIVIDNSANVSVNSLIVNVAAGQSGVAVTKNTTGTQTVNLSDLQINGGANGVEVTGNGTGTLNMTINDSEILDSTAFGLTFDNIDAGTIQVNNTTIDGNNASAGAVGVRILNSNANFTFDSDPANDDTVIQGFGGTDFLVDGGTPTLTFAGRIVNSSSENPGDTTGRSVVIQNTTGGTKTFSSASEITDDNEGMLVQNNSSGTASFLGTNEFNVSGANTAVTLDNNDVSGTNMNMTFAGLDITATGTGRGLVATNGGTLSVTGLNNRIDTENGLGLQASDMNIGTVDFAEVTVDGGTGPTNAIVLQNLTGGQVAIGTTTGGADSGGVLRSTGDAIILQNVQNVDLRQMRIESAGGIGVNIDQTAATTINMDVTIDGLTVDSAATAIDVLGADANNTFNLRITDSVLNDQVTMSITGSSAFLLLMDNNTVTTAGLEDAVSLSFSGSAQNGDVTIRNNNTFTAANANAFSLTANGTNADIDLRIDDNDFMNNSGASETASFLTSGGATLDATIVNNSFFNSGAADEYYMLSNGSSTRVNLDLDNNTAGGAGVYHLETANNGGGFNFGVVDRDSADANNTGTINFDPLITDFEDIDGPVGQPIVP